MLILENWKSYNLVRSNIVIHPGIYHIRGLFPVFLRSYHFETQMLWILWRDVPKDMNVNSAHHLGSWANCNYFFLHWSRFLCTVQNFFPGACFLDEFESQLSGWSPVLFLHWAIEKHNFSVWILVVGLCCWDWDNLLTAKIFALNEVYHLLAALFEVTSNFSMGNDWSICHNYLFNEINYNYFISYNNYYYI